jgi:GNAT superfamily N-acetyltransferase
MKLWRTLPGSEAAEQQVRPLASSDVPAIERLLQESPEAAQWSRTVFLRGLAEGTHAWVAEEGGEVIGMVAARAAAGEAEILNLAVLPQHRRRGLARRGSNSGIPGSPGNELRGAGLLRNNRIRGRGPEAGLLSRSGGGRHRALVALAIRLKRASKTLVAGQPVC